MQTSIASEQGRFGLLAQAESGGRGRFVIFLRRTILSYFLDDPTDDEAGRNTVALTMSAWQIDYQLDVQRANLPFAFLPGLSESPSLCWMCFFILFVRRRRRRPFLGPCMRFAHARRRCYLGCRLSLSDDDRRRRRLACIQLPVRAAAVMMLCYNRSSSPTPAVRSCCRRSYRFLYALCRRLASACVVG